MPKSIITDHIHLGINKIMCCLSVWEGSPPVDIVISGTNWWHSSLIRNHTLDLTDGSNTWHVCMYWVRLLHHNNNILPTYLGLTLSKVCTDHMYICGFNCHICMCVLYVSLYVSTALFICLDLL